MVYVHVCVPRHLKQELAWARDEWLRVIIITMLFKTVVATTKNLKNKTILIENNIVCIAMWPLVMYSN